MKTGGRLAHVVLASLFAIRYQVFSAKNSQGKLNIKEGEPAGMGIDQWSMFYSKSIAELNATEGTESVTHSVTYEMHPMVSTAYKLYTEGMSWVAAVATCAKMGGYLAIVNSISEANVLMDMLNTCPTDALNNTNQDYAFVGIHDIYQEGEFLTIFDEPLLSTGFMRWAYDQPDNWVDSGSDLDEDCVAVDRQGNLNDVKCSWKLAFFCEQDLP